MGRGLGGIVVAVLTALALLSPWMASSSMASPVWTPPSDFSLPFGATAASTQIAYQAGGIATIAFLDATSPAGGSLHVGTIAPGGIYEEELSVAPTGGAAPVRGALAVAPDGAAVLEWAVLDGSDPSSSPVSIFASYRAAGSRIWQSPVAVAAYTQSGSPSAGPQLIPAISADGRGAAATFSPAGGGGTIELATATAGGTWSAVTAPPSAAGAPVAGLALAYDAGGELLAAYTASTGGGYTLTTQMLPAAGHWTAPEQLASATPDSPTLAVAISPAGETYVVYGQATGPAAGGCVAAARASAGSGFSDPICISGSGLVPSATAIAFIGSDPYFAWSAPRAGPSGSAILQSAAWPATSGPPSAPTTLEQASGTGLSGLVSDGDGSVVAFWPGGGTLQDTAFDAGGPVLLADQIPTRTIVHHDIAMSATFEDLWSGTAAATWTFGDGRTALGGEVAHAYGVTGTYTITVSDADRLGNATLRQFTITIAAAPPPPRLSTFAQQRHRWAERRGTVFVFKLDQRARVTFTFIHLLRGRRVLAGRVIVTGHGGSNQLRFRGRLPDGKLLTPGRYSVSLQARAAGGASPIRRLEFTILPSRVHAAAVLAAAITASTSSRAVVSIGPPPLWLPVSGRPTTLTLFVSRSSAAAPSSLNAYVALQSAGRPCGSSAASDRVRPVYVIRGIYSPARRTSAAGQGEYAAAAGPLIIRQHGAVRACVWVARRPAAGGLVDSQAIPLLNGLFAASVSALAPARGSAHAYTMDAAAASSGFRYTAVTTRCGRSSTDPPGTAGPGDLATESVAFGGGSCAGDGTRFSFTSNGGRPLGALVFTVAQAAAAPPHVAEAGGCELDPVVGARVEAAEAYLVADGCRLDRLLSAPYEPDLPRGAVLDAQVDGGVAEIAPAGTAVDLVRNGR